MHYAKSMDICMLLPAFNFSGNKYTITETFLSPYDIDYHPYAATNLQACAANERRDEA